jgi:hypothetical protein
VEEPPTDPGVGGLVDTHLHPHELADRGGPPRRRCLPVAPRAVVLPTHLEEARSGVRAPSSSC